VTGGFNGKRIKRDKQMNITAAFGSELTLTGATHIPNMLLRCYRNIGITDFQMLLLIQLFRLIAEEKENFPTPEMLSQCMGAEEEQIRRELAQLIDDDVITVSEFYDSTRQQVAPGFDFEPLFLKLSDVWAGNRLKELEEAERLMRFAADSRDFDDKPIDDKAGQIIRMFEVEFGKPLSPVEVDQIERWVADRGAQLVGEALKEAVLRGIFNFKYINTILNNWEKSNVKNLEGKAEFERQFRSRQVSYIPKKGKVLAEKKFQQDENTNEARKKAFIRSLYD